jgi:hypothetical protein
MTGAAEIQISMAEAEDICRKAVSLAPQLPGIVNPRFDDFDATTQLQACAGAINIVRAMQALGYRIVRPLQVVEP